LCCYGTTRVRNLKLVYGGDDIMAHGVDAYTVGNEGREIFWNAPFPSELVLFIFAGIAIAVCAYGFLQALADVEGDRPVGKQDR